MSSVQTAPVQVPSTFSARLRHLRLSASAGALLAAGLPLVPTSAQTLIADGATATVVSQVDGETITAAAGITATVADMPVVIFNTNDVTLSSAGRLASTGLTQTVQINAGVTGGQVLNLAGGELLGESRVLDLRGTGQAIVNTGTILGTGNQRNGTVYADGTAQDFSIDNSGVIDAGAGLEGAGFSVELADTGNAFTITNAGSILGRGQAAAGLATAGDGIRLERTRVGGMLDGSTTGLFTGTITNAGTISSEASAGTTAGVRAVNGVSFQGNLTNEAGGTIAGPNNGVYFGTGDHTGGTVTNAGTISSDSRAVNIDGTGLALVNTGTILGTGNQRNGTVYADGTATAFSLTNSGSIDAGAGNQGSGVSFQLGATDGASIAFDLNNSGTIDGRGAALPSGAAAGVRLFGGAAGVTASGDFVNTGTIRSETAAAILIEGVAFTGTLINRGTLSGATAAIDASQATGPVSIVQEGLLDGAVIGSAFADSLRFEGQSTLAADITGGVAVSLASDASLTLQGVRSIEGDVDSAGALSLTLGQDRLTVDGDLTFAAGSSLSVTTPAAVSGLTLNQAITVIDQTGSFTDNGLTVSVADDDFLVDFLVGQGSVTITPVAADLSQQSADANIAALGGAISTAFANGALSATAVDSLNALADGAAFETAAQGLLPSLNEGVTREIFETNSLAASFVDRRLRGGGVGLWAQGLYRTADRDTESLSVSGYDADAAGATIGADLALSDALIAGAAFNYADIQVDDDTGSQADIEAYQLLGYLGYRADRLFATAAAGYSFNTVDTARTSLLGPIDSRFDLDGVTAQTSLGYDLSQREDTVFAPLIGLHFAELSQEGAAERGGLGLEVEGADVRFLDLRAGLEARTSFGGEGDWSFSPEARAAFVYDALGDARSLTLNVPGAAGFQVAGVAPGQSRGEFGIGFELSHRSGFSVNLGYDGEVSDGYSAHGLVARAQLRF